jgi:hypothetical protein
MPRAIPLKICSACGGSWFREADFYKFRREETVGLIWLGWPKLKLVGQDSLGAMTLLVCLCGSPLRPSISGLKDGGRELKSNLAQLLENLESCHARLKERHDRDSVLTAARENQVTLQSCQLLADQLKALERLAGPRTAQQNPSRKSPRGRYWAPPTRKPASKSGVLTVDTLVIALQQIGLTARVAKTAVKTIFASIIQWLQDGGTAPTPLGIFTVVHRSKERPLFRLGRWMKFYTKPKKVVFRASRDLLAAVNRSVPKENPVPASPVTPRSNQLRCEKCGSTHFVEGHFKQYRQQYSSSPGADLSPLTENPVRALVCLCGHPILPGRLRSQGLGDYQSFRPSFEAARQYRESTSSETIMGKVAEIYASKLQQDRLAERIAQLQTILKEPQKPSR